MAIAVTPDITDGLAQILGVPSRSELSLDAKKAIVLAELNDLSRYTVASPPDYWLVRRELLRLCGMGAPAINALLQNNLDREWQPEHFRTFNIDAFVVICQELRAISDSSDPYGSMIERGLPLSYMLRFWLLGCFMEYMSKESSTPVAMNGLDLHGFVHLLALGEVRLDTKGFSESDRVLYVALWCFAIQ